MAKIFDKPANKWVEVPSETYAEYMKYCSSHRKRMQAHSLCRCPRAMWWVAVRHGLRGMRPPERTGHLQIF